MRSKTLLHLAAAVAACGCSSSKVITNVDPAADFGLYRTYGFAPKLGTDDAQYGTLMSSFLKAAATRELEARGYEAAADPDLLVNFYVLTQEKVQSTTTASTFHGYRGYRAWGGYAHDTVVTQYTEGTLSVDVVDARKSQLVWEATLVGRVTNEVRKKLQEACDRAIADVFAEYPFVAGPGSAAPAGDAEAQFLAGAEHYERGELAEAAACYRRAAEQGHAFAQSNLGLMLLDGRGVPADAAEAREWLLAAAEQGIAEAQFTLGSMYLNARGVPADDAQAARWIERAAERGLAVAQADLALLYLKGRGVPEDHGQAFVWCARAAEQGTPAAQDRLGMMYEHGRGVEKDVVSAYAWYRLAAEQGSAAGEEHRARLEKALAPEQVEEAERRAGEWQSRAAAHSSPASSPVSAPR